VTPFRGYGDEGYWLKWLAVPRWVVDRETLGCRRRATPPDGQRGHCRWD
jgi:hypothetical protein